MRVPNRVTPSSSLISIGYEREAGKTGAVRVVRCELCGLLERPAAIAASGERTGFVVTGLLAILIAILLLHHTTTTVAVVGFIVGIFWTISGAAQLLDGFTANAGTISWPIVLLGAIGLAVGILCLVYPSLSLSIICVIIGLGMIVYGLVEILASLQVRALKKI